MVNEKHAAVPVNETHRIMSTDLRRPHQFCAVNQNHRHDTRHIGMTSQSALSDRQVVNEEKFTVVAVLAGQLLQNTMETANGLKDKDKMVDHILHTLWFTVVIETMGRQAKLLSAQG